MTRPITLFTGQGADLPFEEVALAVVRERDKRASGFYRLVALPSASHYVRRARSMSNSGDREILQASIAAEEFVGLHRAVLNGIGMAG